MLIAITWNRGKLYQTRGKKMPSSGYIDTLKLPVDYNIKIVTINIVHYLSGIPLSNKESQAKARSYETLL